MKNINGMFINKVIHDFKDIALGVKARKQKFIVIPFNKTVKQGARKSHADIRFCDTMFECSLIEKVMNNHFYILYLSGKR